MEELRLFTSDWNAANLKWLSAYADDAVSIDEYLRISYEVERLQRTLLLQFALAANGFPQWMQDSVADLIENYQGRANAFQNIVAAEVAADNAAWQAAFDEYYSHSGPEATIPIIEELFSQPEMAAALAAEGIDSDDLMEALMVAFGGG